MLYCKTLENLTLELFLKNNKLLKKDVRPSTGNFRIDIFYPKRSLTIYYTLDARKNNSLAKIFQVETFASTAKAKTKDFVDFPFDLTHTATMQLIFRLYPHAWCVDVGEYILFKPGKCLNGQYSNLSSHSLVSVSLSFQH